MKNHLTPFAIALFLIIGCAQSADQKQPASPLDEAAETAAIMKVIEGETASFFNGKYEDWVKHWSHSPYTMQAWNNDDGTFDASVGWEKINAQGKMWIEKYYANGQNIIHPVVKREKPLVKFFDDKTAYLIWKQYNADKEQKYYRASQETRLMEKQSDGWKIVNVSAFWDSKNNISPDSLPL